MRCALSTSNWECKLTKCLLIISNSMSILYGQRITLLQREGNSFISPMPFVLCHKCKYFNDSNLRTGQLLGTGHFLIMLIVAGTEDFQRVEYWGTYQTLLCPKWPGAGLYTISAVQGLTISRSHKLLTMRLLIESTTQISNTNMALDCHVHKKFPDLKPLAHMVWKQMSISSKQFKDRKPASGQTMTDLNTFSPFRTT